MPYRELNKLSSAAYGVSIKDSSTYLRSDARTLVIGLGGTGQEAVCRLKKELTKRIGFPSRDKVRFLIFDTASNEITKRIEHGELEDSEVVRMHNNALAGMFAVADGIPEAIKKLIPGNFTFKYDGTGANQTRLAGKLTMYDPTVYDEIKQKVSNAFHSLLNGVANMPLYVYFICGIGGGTGSGLVTDVPYLIRKLYNDLGVTASVTMVGNIILPNVHKDQNNWQKAYGNGFAALKEIDYYMNLPKGEEYYTTFPDGNSYRSDKNIFDTCILIGGEKSLVVVPENQRRDMALDACVNNMISMVTNSNYSAPGSNGDKAVVYLTDSFKSNESAARNALFTTNKNANFPKTASYSFDSIGASVLKFPMIPMFEYITAVAYTKAVQKFEENRSKITDKEVDEFEKKVGIAPRAVIEKAVAKFNEILDEKFNAHNWTRKGEHDNDLFLTIQTATSNPDSFCRQDFENAANKAVAEAFTIFTDIKKGPYYAERLLTQPAGGTFKGYFERINSYSKVIDDIITEATNSVSVCTGALARYDGNKKKDEYKNLVRELETAKFRKKLAEVLKELRYNYNTGDNFLRGLRQTVESSVLYYHGILKALQPIMEDNYNNTHAELYNVEAGTAGTIMGLTSDSLGKIKTTISTQAKRGEMAFNDEQNVNTFALRLLNSIKDDPADWKLSKDTVEGMTFNESFRNFVKEFFASEKDRLGWDYTDNSLVNFLEETYKNDTATVKQQVANDIVSALINGADPTYTIWPSIAPQTFPELNFKYVVIPNNIQNSAWGEAFSNALHAYPHLQTMSSPENDSFYCFNTYVCMPLWLHSRVTEYEKNYNDQEKRNIHVNEGDAVQPPLCEYPSPIVAEAWNRASTTVEPYFNPVEKNFNEAVSAVVDNCLTMGAIFKDGDNKYKVRYIDFGDEVQISKKTLNMFKRDNLGNLVCDPASISEQLEKKIEKYIKECKKNGDTIKVDDVFYKQLFDSCDYSKKRVLEISENHPGTYPILSPTSVEEIKPLIRRQMSLLGDLLVINAFLCEVKKRIESILLTTEDKNRRMVFYKFVQFGLIYEENGRWKYNTGKDSDVIVTKMILNDDETMTKFKGCFELGAYKFFIKMDGYGKIKEKLSDAQKKLLNNIYDDEELRKAVIERCNKLIATSDKFIDKISDIDEDERTKNDLTILEFYNDMKNSCADVLDSI